MRITVTERGEIESQTNVTMKSRVEGTTTIIRIISEGTVVAPPVLSEVDGTVVAIEEANDQEVTITVRGADGETVAHPVEVGDHTEIVVSQGSEVKAGDILAGDLCVELDSSQLQEKEKQQQIDVTRATADLEKAQKDVELKRTQIESDTASARLTFELAQLDLDNYTSGEFQQQVNTIDGKILIAQQELNQAKENYEFAKRVAKKGYKSQNELETARIAVVKAQNTLNVEQGNLKVLREFTYTRTIKEYTERAEDSKREIERVRLAGEAAMAQVTAEYKARELMYQLEIDKLRRYQQQIAACKMIAPQAGQVVYASVQSSRGSSVVVIEEGASVRENQEVIRLPDFSQMQVEARIHESKISQLQLGLSVLIEIDAFPGEVFHGVIDTISSVPLPGRWPNFDLKEYEAGIRILDATERVEKLKPGLTASIQIIVGERDNVLQVPVQAVIAIGEMRLAYVLTPSAPERRPVKTGDASDTHIEILDGVAEGETVILNPRTSFADQLNDLETKYGKPKEEKVDFSEFESSDSRRPPNGAAPANGAAPRGRNGDYAKDRANGKGPGTGGGRPPGNGKDRAPGKGDARRPGPGSRAGARGDAAP